MRAAAYLPDRARGCVRDDARHSAAGDLRGELSRDAAAGDDARLGLRGMSARGGTDHRPHLRSRRPQADAAHQPARHVHRFYHHGAGDIALDALRRAYPRRRDRGQPVAGAGLHLRPHGAGPARQVVRPDRHRLRRRLLHRAVVDRVSVGEVQPEYAHLSRGGDVGDEHSLHGDAADGRAGVAPRVRRPREDAALADLHQVLQPSGPA